MIRGKGTYRGGKELGKGQEGVGEEQEGIGGELVVEMTLRHSV